MMRMVGLVTLASVALGAPAWSDDMYRWTDSSGRVHYTNTAVAKDEPPPPAAEAPPLPEASLGDEVEATPTAPVPLSEDESAALSASVSLRRNQIEREVRTTDRRIREIDARIKTLADARKSRGATSVGSGPAGVDLRSEEEKDLAAQREQLAQHVTELRNQAAKLRQEVSAQLGGTPGWWIDVR